MAAAVHGSPAVSHAVRAMLNACSPTWLTQPPTTDGRTDASTITPSDLPANLLGRSAGRTIDVGGLRGLEDEERRRRRRTPRRSTQVELVEGVDRATGGEARAAPANSAEDADGHRPEAPRRGAPTARCARAPAMSPTMHHARSPMGQDASGRPVGAVGSGGGPVVGGVLAGWPVPPPGPGRRRASSDRRASATPRRPRRGWRRRAARTAGPR